MNAWCEIKVSMQLWDAETCVDTAFGPHDAHLLLRSNASFYYSALLKVFVFGFQNKCIFSSAE